MVWASFVYRNVDRAPQWSTLSNECHKSQTTFEAKLDCCIIERRIQLYGFPLRVCVCRLRQHWCCFVLNMVCVRRSWGLFGTSFLVPFFLPRPYNSAGEKCWESQIGLDSLVRFGDYKLYSILGVSWSIPGIHARCEARNWAGASCFFSASCRGMCFQKGISLFGIVRCLLRMSKCILILASPQGLRLCLG